MNVAMKRISSSDELEVCEEVGRGGFGVVYRGIVKASGQEVAIKQIDLENDLADIYEVNREITILSECRLRQITRYLGCFVKSYKLWVIMEYVNGGSLFDLLKAGSVEDEHLVAVIAKEILVALQYLHEQGKIHRDLKSQNILLSHEGEVKLTDFGVSTQLSSNFSRRNTTVGTPYWMAPEVIINSTGGHSFKADIWSFGCCVYELRNGRPPLQESYSPMKALRRMSSCRSDEEFLQLIAIDNKEWSDLLKDFLRQCFVVEPSNRASASRLLRHEFISLADELPDELKRKGVRKIITKKLLWDQENHVVRTRRYYAPTEIALNQQKWQMGGDLDNGAGSDQQVHFDLSSIKEDPPSNDEQGTPRISSSETQRSASPASSSVSARSEIPPVNRQVKADFIKILNKIFRKIEQRISLTTEQYDELVSVNEKLIELFVPVPCVDGANNHQNKILVTQYLKYLLKEVSKPQTENISRPLLQKFVLPSVMQEVVPSETLIYKRKGTGSAADDIEASLLDTWLNKMSSN